MKLAWAALALGLAVLATSCATRKDALEALQPFDYSAIPLDEARAQVQAIQVLETQGGKRKSAARETLEALRLDYQEAGEQDKPRAALRLTEAQAAYLEAQKQHVEAKRTLALAQNAYLRKLVAMETQGGVKAESLMPVADRPAPKPPAAERAAPPAPPEGAPAPAAEAPALPPPVLQAQPLAPPAAPPRPGTQTPAPPPPALQTPPPGPLPAPPRPPGAGAERTPAPPLTTMPPLMPGSVPQTPPPTPPSAAPPAAPPGRPST